MLCETQDEALIMHNGWHLHVQVSPTPTHMVFEHVMHMEVGSCFLKFLAHAGVVFPWFHQLALRKKVKKTCEDAFYACLQELNAAPVVPEGFSSWQPVMDGWGTKMVAATEVSLHSRVHGSRQDGLLLDMSMRRNGMCRLGRHNEVSLHLRVQCMETACLRQARCWDELRGLTGATTLAVGICLPACSHECRVVVAYHHQAIA